MSQLPLRPAPAVLRLVQIVDLAGCERPKTSNVVGTQLAEATAINKSLSALGDVMGCLAGKGTAASNLGLAGGGGGGAATAPFIPYRNSKLTLLLQDSLRPHGRAKVLLFVTASPELASWNESVAALTFASRCRAVDLYRGAAAAPAPDTAAAAATEAELAAANKKIAEMAAQIRRLSA